MLLLLIRHAHAGDRDPTRFPDDTLRPLTRKGQTTHRKVARALCDLGLMPGTIFSSPWLRAWETAAILGGAARPRIEPIAAPALAGAPVMSRLGRALGPRAPDETVALVGHEPWLGELASLLLTGRANGLAIDFGKSAVLGMDLPAFDAGEGTLRFFLRPRLL
jgi:phosphohistidine phosphatase